MGLLVLNKTRTIQRCTFRRIGTPTLFQHNDFTLQTAKGDLSFVFRSSVPSTSFKGQDGAIPKLEIVTFFFDAGF